MTQQTPPPSISQIGDALRDISTNFLGVHVEDEIVKRRSSVALILRFPNLATADLGNESPTVIDLINAGTETSVASYPEILFIKRTSRKGDRWSGHVALPGGKRDPEDESDEACAVREAHEEVGLDLNELGRLVGPLDQRLVRTSWGRVTLMTLCPFVYVLTPEAVRLSYEGSLLTLEPAEIDRAFWIPVDQLYFPERASSFETVGLGDRLRLHKSPFLPKPLITALCRVNAFGEMHFGAIDLTEPRNLILSDPNEKDKAVLPYKLWGLTHGIIVDLLELFQPHSAAQFFLFPTLTAPDIRFFIYVFSYNYVKSKRDAFIRGPVNRYHEGQLDITGKALANYFPFLAKAIYAGLAFRATVVAVIIYFFLRRKLRN